MCLNNSYYQNNITDNLSTLLDEEIIQSLVNCSYQSPDEIKNKEGLTVLHLNIQSLAAKFNELKILLSNIQDSVDVLVLCETFIKHDRKTRFEIKGFSDYHFIRENERGGGLSIYIKNCINHIVRDDLNEMKENCECAFIEIYAKNCRKNILVGEIYRRPNTVVKQFNEWYAEKLKVLTKENKQIILGMDQNINLLHANEKCFVEEFLDINIGNGLIPSIMIPTRVTKNTATLIDNIFVSQDINNIMSTVLECDISDHYPCILNTEVSDLSIDDYYETRSINEKKQNDLIKFLNCVNWSKMYALSFQDKCDFLVKRIEIGVETYMPVKQKINTEKLTLPMWMDNELLVEIRERDKLFRKRKTKWDAYKKKRNEVQRLMRRKKKQFVEERLAKFKNNSSVIWSMLNGVIQKRGKSSMSGEYLINGIIETNTKIIADEFCKFFKDIAKNTVEKVRKKGKISSTTLTKKEMVRNSKCMYVFEPDMSEITKLVEGLKNKTSSGYDGVSNVLFKAIYDSIKAPLYHIYRESLITGQFPNAFKKAIIKPLYKKGTKMEINNYRPISLLPVISKILEQLMYKRVVSFIDSCKLFYEGQYGFRKNRSTIDALTDVLISILNGLENNKVVILLMLDMSKAFDSLNHKKLLNKLEYMGIGGVALKWFTEYLADRKVQVKVGGELSEEVIMHTGTAQGSNLGPLLYILYTNDVTKYVKFSENVVFADDTSLVSVANNIKSCKAKLKEDLIHLYNYYIDNELCLNLDKTCYILFKRGKKTDLSSIQLADIDIKEVVSSKLLGLTIDNDLSWKPHVDLLIKKLRSSLYALHLAHKYVDEHHRKLLYFALFFSQLQYGIGLWGSMISQKLKNRLQVLQNNCVRKILDIGKKESVKKPMLENKLLTVSQIVELEQSKIMYRIQHDLISSRICNKFNQLSRVQHEYNTRHRNDSKIPIHHTSRYSKSFLVLGPKLWISLTNTTKEKSSIKAYSKARKIELLSVETT